MANQESCQQCGIDLLAAMKKPHHLYAIPIDMKASPEDAAPVIEFGSFAPPLALHGGSSHFIALDGTGQFFSWGRATFGQLGQGDGMDDIQQPAPLDLLTLRERSGMPGGRAADRTPAAGSRPYVEGAFAGPAQSVIAVRYVVSDASPTCSLSCALRRSTEASTLHLYAAGMLNGQSDCFERLYCIESVLEGAHIAYDSDAVKILSMAFSSSCCVMVLRCTPTRTAVFSFGPSTKGHLALGKATNFVQHPCHIASLGDKKVLAVSSSQFTFAARTEDGHVYVWGEVYIDSPHGMTPLHEPVLIACAAPVATVRAGEGFVLMTTDAHDVLQFGCCEPYAATETFTGHAAVEVLRKKRITAIACRDGTALAISGSSSSKAYVWGTGPLVDWINGGEKPSKYLAIPTTCFSSLLGQMRVQDLYLSHKWEIVFEGTMKRAKKGTDSRGNSPCIRSRAEEVKKDLFAGQRSQSFENLSKLREADSGAGGHSVSSSSLAQSARGVGKVGMGGGGSGARVGAGAVAAEASVCPRTFSEEMEARLESAASQNRTKVVEWGAPNPLEEAASLAVHRVHRVSCAGVHCAAITVNGRAYTWGRGSCGELGHGTDIKNTYKPTRVASLTSERVRDVRCGPSQTAFVTRSERLLVTGLMCNTNYWTPEEIPCGSGESDELSIRSVNMSASVLYCIIEEDQVVKLMVLGDSSKGMLGLGRSTMCTKKPTVVPFALEFVPCDIATGDHHVAVIGECGKMYEWGETSLGLAVQLSRLSTTWEPRHVRIPKEVGKPVHVVCGRSSTFVLTSLGRVVAWGFNKNGVLGIGWNDPDLGQEPTVLPALENEHIIGIHCGGRVTAAWTREGKIWMWGRGNEGCLGSAKKSDTAIPKPITIPNATHLGDIKCGYTRCIALLYDDAGEGGAATRSPSDAKEGTPHTAMPGRSSSSTNATRARRLSIRAGFMASSMGVVRSRRSSQSISKDAMGSASMGALPVLPAGSSSPAVMARRSISRPDEQNTPVRRETDIKGVYEVVREAQKVAPPQQLKCALATARKISLPRPVLSYMSPEYLQARDVVHARPHQGAASGAPGTSPGSSHADMSLCSPKLDSASDSLLEWLRETVFSARRLCVLIFFRGSWCPFDRSYLQAWSEYVERAEEQNGLILGISTQDTIVTASLASLWGLQFPLLSDLYLELTREYGVTQGRVRNPLQQKNYSGSAGVMCQPGVVLLQDGKPVFTWTSTPQGGNLNGAANRPCPDSVWRVLESAQKPEEMMIAQSELHIEFRSRPTRGSSQERWSTEAAVEKLRSDLEESHGDLVAFWSRVKSGSRYAVLIYFPGLWHLASTLWLRRWESVASELELAGCLLYAATTESQADMDATRIKGGYPIPLLGLGSSLALPQAHNMKISKRKGSPTGAVLPGLIIMNTVGDVIYQYVSSSSLLSSSTSLPDPLDIWKSLQMLIEDKASKLYERKKQRKTGQMHAYAKVNMSAPSNTPAYTNPHTNAEQRAAKLLQL